MSIKSLYPDISPSFNLNFAESKSLDPRITFIRNSTATYVGSNGLIQDSRYGSPRFDHDPVTGESLGLLIEEQRTNIVTNSVNLSEYFTIIRTSEIDNSIVSPDGTTNASFLREDTELNNYHYIRRISPPTGTYTLSFYAKAGTRSWVAAGDNMGLAANRVSFNLSSGTVGTVGSSVASSSIADVGNGWYRCSMTTDFQYYIDIALVPSDPGSSDSATRYDGDGTSGLYIWGVQYEQGSFPTSYIPTSGSTVTRTQDFASIAGTNFTEFYNNIEGSLYSEFILNGLDPGYNNTSVMINNNTENEYIAIFGHDPAYAWVQSSGGTSFGPSLGSSTTTGTNYKVAMAYKLNDFAATLNGGSVSIGTGGVVPTVDRMFIGRRYAVNASLNGTIKKLAYYPQRLTNAQLQLLTQ